MAIFYPAISGWFPFHISSLRLFRSHLDMVVLWTTSSAARLMQNRHTCRSAYVNQQGPVIPNLGAVFRSAIISRYAETLGCMTGFRAPLRTRKPITRRGLIDFNSGLKIPRS